MPTTTNKPAPWKPAQSNDDPNAYYGCLHTLADMHAYLDHAAKSFEDDPADSDYQMGYLGAIVEFKRMLAPARDTH